MRCWLAKDCFTVTSQNYSPSSGQPVFLHICKIIQILQSSIEYYYSFKLFLFNFHKYQIIVIIQKMKPNKFKLRSFQSNTKNHSPNLDAKFSEDGAINHNLNTEHLQPNANQDLNKIFKHILLSLEKLNSSISIKRQDLEVRDRSYLLQLPLGSSFKKRRQVIMKWVDKMVNDVASIAFNYYSNEQLTYQQTKVYCSENILSNIAALVSQYDLDGVKLKEIDQFIRDDVLELLLKKYPLTESIVVNRALQAVAKAPDLSDKIQNDFFFINKHMFEAKNDYSHQIKSVINSIIKIANEKNTVARQMSNFEVFKKCMGKIFEIVEDLDWMESSQNERNDTFKSFVDNINRNEILNPTRVRQVASVQNESRVRQYKEKVKHYTSYLIGRKVSQNTSPFSEEEIESKGLQVKNTAILRILTKWCEQLWQKFIPKNYFMNRSEDFMLRNGQIKSLSTQMRSQLDKLMQLQKAEIKSFMSKLTNDNYQAQINLLNQLLQNGQEQFREQHLKKVSEKFSVLIGKSLQKWVVKYLNRLLQGLCKVAEDFHDKYMSNDWRSPPNLITFKIGDLMRCKCSSGERQILYIFKQIKWLSDNKPQLLSITRIKNRLSLGTNDILMNIKFGGSTICQIQLAVKSNKSKFLKASNGMSHYFYELQRSLFGPINELGSIWCNLDLRASYFDKKASGGKSSGSHRCELSKKAFQFQVFDGPFICNICNSTYSQNKLLVKHAKCSQCSFWKCAHCQIKLSSCEDLASKFVSDVLIRKICKKKVEIDEQNKDFPQFGVAVSLKQEKYSSLVIFKKIEVRGVNYLFTKQQGTIKLLLKLTQEGGQQRFIKQHILFELNSYNGEKLLDLTLSQVNEQYFLPIHVAECYRNKKTSISLQNQPLNQQNCNAIFEGRKSDQLAITSLSLVNTDITSIRPLDQLFPNVQQLCLNRSSKLTNFQTLLCFFKMASFTMREVSELKVFPRQICSVVALTKLDLKDCQFQEIPDCIGELKQLRYLDISHRQGKEFNMRIGQIPKQLYGLTSLQELNLSYQGIRLIDQDIGKLSSLKSLNLRNNQFNRLPQTINNLTLLEFIDFRENPLIQLPKSVAGLAKLKEFRLQKIGEYYIKDEFEEEIICSIFEQLPQDLQQIQQLKIIDVHSQNLQVLPPLQKCKNLQEISLYRCSLAAAPRLCNCFSLRRINLKKQNRSQGMFTIDDNFFKETPNLVYFCASFNCLTGIPQSIKYLTQLQEFDLSHNQIYQVCQELGSCQNLIKLNLQNNKIYKLNQSISDCVNLRELYLNNNSIGELGECMGKLTKLCSLNLQQNLIQTLPKSLDNLKKMQQGKFLFSCNPLYNIECLELVKKADSYSKSIYENIQSGEFKILFSYYISDISDKIGKATHLKYIDVSRQKLAYLPQSFSALVNLQTLNLSSNQFQQFPQSVAGCLGLKSLMLQSNSIVEIPAAIGRLINLQTFDITQNNLIVVNEAINNCISLKRLFLSSNKIQTIIDDTFSTLVNLQSIFIIANGLTQFPQGITKCLNLRQIDLGCNKIPNISQNLYKLTKLNILSMYYNKIKEIPLTICKAKSLQQLDLSYNQIQVLVTELSELTTTLNIRGNPIKRRECSQWFMLYGTERTKKIVYPFEK